jgi:hypothetical protein
MLSLKNISICCVNLKLNMKMNSESMSCEKIILFYKSYVPDKLYQFVHTSRAVIAERGHTGTTVRFPREPLSTRYGCVEDEIITVV